MARSPAPLRPDRSDSAPPQAPLRPASPGGTSAPALRTAEHRGARAHPWTGTPRRCTGSTAARRPPSSGRSSGPPRAAGSSIGTACGSERGCGTGLGGRPTAPGDCSTERRRAARGAAGPGPAALCRYKLYKLTAALSQRQSVEKKLKIQMFLYKSMPALLRIRNGTEM